MTRLTFAALLLLAPALAGCGEPEEKTYVTDTVDKSGGELIVRDADEPSIPVNVPETPMTNVPVGEDTPAPAASPPAASPDAPPAAQ